MTISQYIQTFISLLVLFGILFGFLKLSKIFQAKKFTGEIEVIDRVPIESQVSLLIVKIRDKEMLISVGGKEIKVLDQLK